MYASPTCGCQARRVSLLGRYSYGPEGGPLLPGDPAPTSPFEPAGPIITTDPPGTWNPTGEIDVVTPDPPLVGPEGAPDGAGSEMLEWLLSALLAAALVSRR